MTHDEYVTVSVAFGQIKTILASDHRLMPVTELTLVRVRDSLQPLLAEHIKAKRSVDDRHLLDGVEEAR